MPSSADATGSGSENSCGIGVARKRSSQAFCCSTAVGVTVEWMAAAVIVAEARVAADVLTGVRVVVRWFAHAGSIATMSSNLGVA